MRRGFTLIEMLIVIVLLTTLVHISVQSFTMVMRVWASQDAAMGIREDVHQGMEKMLYDLRTATAISVADDSIRYTVDESGTDAHYIFYLYHTSDSWVPAYTQTVYELRKAALTGGIGGTFTYGDGVLYIKAVQPPTTSDLSASGNLITIDLTVSKYNEAFRLRQQVKPRNL
jgi:prepilin-type N-terminal cleavage/methylation domain-containing protein